MKRSLAEDDKSQVDKVQEMCSLIDIRATAKVTKTREDCILVERPEKQKDIDALGIDHSVHAKMTMENLKGHQI